MMERHKNIKARKHENENNEKSEIALREEKILEFWEENKIFEKSLEKPSPKGDFVFYDGPPFATGVPHYGHILPTTMKDVIPRYKTMKGYRVERIWGWDCHGLPIENLIEKELGLETKKDIEKYGVAKFNEAAEDSVLRYADVWKDVIPRVGRWIDMERDYKTMDYKYTESIWWAFKSLFDKGLIYEGHKSMHVCPRCETTLSNFEVTQEYKDITDISVTAKFQLLNDGEKIIPSEVEGKSTSSSTDSGHAKTYVLAWTTTPWTLPGNVALAVGEDIDYVKIRTDEQNNSGQSAVANNGLGRRTPVPSRFQREVHGTAEEQEFYILAKKRLEDVFKDKKYEIVEELKGKDLIGKSYEPLFDYYSKQQDLENRENGWKIYGANFVTTEDGTGIVHIAPAFGEDDMNLGKKENLPFIQHVALNGTFKEEVKDFKGQSVKPKDEPQSADIEIIKHLARKELLFAKQKITHSYPHCWRCDTPLLNYAATSWFVKVTSIVKNLLKNNKKTKWVPGHMRDGRFGKWLEGARDWAISRQRYWGASLPVWRCDKCEKQKVVGGIDDLKKNIKKSNNNYFVMRHGEAESNRDGYVSSKIENKTPLTENGKRKALSSAKKLKNKNIDLIFASPFLRTKETAEIIAEELGIQKDSIIFDEKIKEIDTGEFNLKTIDEYRNFFFSTFEKLTKRPLKGENIYDVRKRAMDFLYDVDRKYVSKNILIVTHEYPIWMLVAGSQGLNKEKTVKIKDLKEDFINTGEFIELPFTPIPHDEQYELDLHRPYIDNVVFQCECGAYSNTSSPESRGSSRAGQGTMKRIPDVFDCWFESGSMPYASLHYPFENEKKFHKRLPADFIAEGIDQTRGWFYSLMVLSTALFDKPTFKNVVVNGLIMGEDGKKMSKRLKNYPDLDLVLDTYGADALRLFLMDSPAVHAEEVALSEKGIHEVLNKVMNRLWNVVLFYELYSDPNLRITSESTNSTNSTNVLDVWILERLYETILEIEAGLESYEFDKASRPIESFVDDLSTWYLRRSRDRFKGKDEADKQAALSVTQYVLLEFSKAIAPIIPFVAESVFQKVRGDDCKESVHLEKYPVSSIRYPVWNKILSFFSLSTDHKLQTTNLLENMKKVREIVSLGLEARQKAGVKVRQPLQRLVARSQALGAQFAQLIKDEMNVKKVAFNSSIENEVELDTEITPELKQEGDYRELLRGIQDARKKEGLNPNDEISLTIETSGQGVTLTKGFEREIKKTAQVRAISFNSVSGGHEIKIDDLEFKIKISK